MKKIILVIILSFVMIGQAIAADTILIYRIPEEKVATALTGLLKVYPNTETIDNIPDGTLKYTNAQWVKEVIRKNIIRDIRRGLQMIANENTQVTLDNDSVQ